MRLALISPPFIRPTSPPLGPAILSSYIKTNLDDINVRCFDLSLTYYLQLFQAVNQESLKIKLYNWNEETTRLRLAETLDFFKNCNWENLSVSRYHHFANILLSFENIFNAFMANMAKKYLLDQEIPEKIAKFFRDLMAPVLEFSPDLLGISVLFTQQMEFAALLAKIGREHKNIPTVLGGARIGVMIKPERLLSEPWPLASADKGQHYRLGQHIDFLIAGEGERALLGLCDHLQGHRKMAEVPNLIYFSNEQIKINPPEVITDLDEIPGPDFSDFSLNDYLSPRVILPMQLSRGCPWARCAFCTHHHSYLRFRTMKITRCVEQIKELQDRYGADCFNFYDEMILADRFAKLAAELNRRELNITYAAYAKPTAKFDLELLKNIHQSGCRVLMWGVESASQRILDLMRKGTKIEQVEKVLRAAAEAGIMNLVFILFGFPSETEEEFLATVELLKRNKQHIHTVCKGTFVLGEGSDIHRCPEAFAITNIHEKPGSGPVNRLLGFEVTQGLSPQQADIMLDEHLAEIEKTGLSPRFGNYRDHLLLMNS
jgi:radical SAM superfamily enzyme YgiQ (UPF0313 family)